MPIEETLLGKLRREYKPRIPKILENVSQLKFDVGKKTTAMDNENDIKKLFPNTFGQPILDLIIDKMDNESNSLKVGVVLSGGQAAGGHTVISGLFDTLQELNKKSSLIGFTNGPRGIIKNEFIKIDAKLVEKYRNTGGFDMICSGRDKIETEEDRLSTLKTVKVNDLDGLVIIGGDDSNTNAAILAEYFKENKCKCCVIGVPKTIDGDLQNDYIETSFGFDSAVKTYSEMISNIARDAISATKAWHFIKLMGRDASQVTLDCILQTHCNIALIGEEIQKEELLLHDITDKICDIIEYRSSQGKDYGVVLIPEGVISFIPSMKALISDLSELLKANSPHIKALEELNELSDKIKYVRECLKKTSKTNLQNFDVLPKDIQAQLLLERDPHGNIQMSQVPIEQLFMLITEQKLLKRKTYKGKFRGNGHFFGYDGRSCFPTNFDTNYCYSLGRVAALLISNSYNGYMTRIYDLEHETSQWKAGAIPITMLFNIEIRHGKPKPVIKKALVNLEGEKFSYFVKNRNQWELEDCYRYVGPIQFFGPKELTDAPPMNVLLNKTGDIKWPVGQNNKNNQDNNQNEQKNEQKDNQ